MNGICDFSGFSLILLDLLGISWIFGIFWDFFHVSVRDFFGVIYRFTPHTLGIVYKIRLLSMEKIDQNEKICVNEIPIIYVRVYTGVSLHF